MLLLSALVLDDVPFFYGFDSLFVPFVRAGMLQNFVLLGDRLDVLLVHFTSASVRLAASIVTVVLVLTS